MRWLFRPWLLLVLSATLALGAAALVWWPWAADTGPHPLTVADGEQEIVWLYSATSASSWERFVTAVQTAAARPDLGLAVDRGRAFPAETTAVPELTVSAQGSGGRLVFRWYKLTSDWKTEKWVQALAQRSPPPLAIIGGSSSDPAIELANCLQDRRGGPNAGPVPLLLLTQATADEGLRRDGAPVPLTRIYDGRTYRFCFTNQQMAEALSDFVWAQEGLRPDGDPFYLAYWEDDAYSRDLATRFIGTLEPRFQARAAARTWAWQAATAATGAPPLDLRALPGRLADLAIWEPIYCGVGGFDQPNRWEETVAGRLVARRRHDPAARSVLVLPAASAQPARRFLRGLMRASPAQAQRLVVVTGDAISFSTVYRDRSVAWPIQDLPFDLVFFCHRNPVDAQAGFRQEGDGAEGTAGENRTGGATGTDDVLLYGDIVETLAQACFQPAGMPAGADELGQRLAQARWRPAQGRVGLDETGPLLFDEQGNRRSGTGEHIVWLRPAIRRERIQPRATLTVWSARGDEDFASLPAPRLGPAERWRPSREPLHVDYETSGE
jgi:hypothetical protein